MSTPPRSRLDGNQILQRMFDDTTGKIRTDTTATIETPPDGIAVDITHTNDSVRLGDGSNLTTVTPIGNKKGLDVNIISDLQLNISAESGDSVILSDGENDLAVNSDGSLNVNVVSSNTSTMIYDEINGVPSANLTTIVSHQINSPCKLKYINASGDNIATYQVQLNGNTIEKKRTYFGNSLNTNFSFSSGLKLTSGDVVSVKVFHQRPYVGQFNASIILE